MKIEEILREKTIIAATKLEDLEKAIKSDVGAVILMNLKLSQILKGRISEYNKLKPIFIHFDLIKGLSSDGEGVKFLKENINFTGIVSTKGAVIRSANKEGFQTIQRVFLIDTQSLESSIESIIENNPNVIEIMPGIVTEVIDTYQSRVNKPIILAGLITKRSHIEKAFESGASGVSLSDQKFWNLLIN